MNRSSAVALVCGLLLAARAMVAADPFPDRCLESRLLPEGAAGGLGSSAAMDGDTAVLGAPSGDGFIGVAEVWRRAYGTWSREAVLRPFDGEPGDAFGTSVALYRNTVLVGAPRHDAGGEDTGAVYVFVRAGSGWAFQAKIVTPMPHPGALLGQSVSTEEGIALVGAPGRNESRGAAWVFQELDVAWRPLYELIPADAQAGDQVGFSVALHSRRALVGAPFHDGSGRDSGGAWIFGRRGAEVVELAKLVPASLGPGDRFGHAVALSNKLALVGAPFDDDSSFAGGSAFVFRRVRETWIEDGILLAPEGSGGENLGWSVGLEEATAIAGAPRGHADLVPQTGAAYLFRRDAEGWHPGPRLISSSPEFLNDFGTSVALGGGRSLVGARGEDGFDGAGYIHDWNDADTDQTADACEPCIPDGFEPDVPCPDATLLPMAREPQRQIHTLCPAGEYDLFRFEAEAGRIYRFATGGDTDMALAVLGPSCAPLLLKNDTCDGVTENACLTWQATGTGEYRVLATGASAPGAYDLIFQEVDGLPPCEPDGRELDDGCRDAHTILPTTEENQVLGTLCPAGDQDHFRFEATAGTTYRFWTTGGADTVGYLLDGGCRRLASNDDCDRPGELNFCLEWTAPADAVHGVRIRGFSGGSEAGPYTFHYRVLP